MTLTVGSLFSGIGGLELGLERAGMTVRWQVEIDEWCRRVLAKHWPGVTRYTDIKAIDWTEVEPVDLVCGGFPCQPVSLAGKRLAQDDPRWLWPEFARCLRALRPRFALMENVPGLLSAGMGDVLGDLAALGYDAEWDCIPAAAVGAPHLRYRVFIVANAASVGRMDRELQDDSHESQKNQPLSPSPLAHAGCWHGGSGGPGRSEYGGEGLRESERPHQDVEYPDGAGFRKPEALYAGGRFFGEGQREYPATGGTGGAGDIPDAHRERREEQRIGVTAAAQHATAERHREDAPDTDASLRDGRSDESWRGPERRTALGWDSWWSVEPPVGRVAHGIPARVDRLRGLGNAVVPQVAEWVGRRIMEVI